MKNQFYIVDVFAESRYAGNQLAVFRNAANFSGNDMQKIARETNFAETTFIMSDEPRNGGYDVRIFTPGEEVDFAGHPTLGTASIIQERIIKKPVDKVILNLKVGQVPVTFPVDNSKETILWMKQIEPEFGKTISVEIISKILGLHENDFDSRWPIQQVSTGLPATIIPLKNLESLKLASISKEPYQNFINDSWAKVILVFCPEGYNENHDISVRVFVDCFGIPEDPATGSGNGCLAAYLVKNRYFESDSINIVVAQGYEIQRPSQLYLRAKEENGSIHVSVGGKVVPIAEGLWG